MENTFVPQIKSKESDSYKLYLYVEQIRQQTEGRLKHIENQLETVKQMLKGGD